MLYISHNHPDHLHPETITRLINKNTFTITGDFASGSSEKMLKRTGMSNVHALAFKDVYQWKDEPVYFSVIKSGDFRDDSGIYLNIYGFEILMTVDSNFINGYILPKKLDLLFTAFASGASGYPLCFENLTKEEKERVLRRNIAAEMIKVSDIIKKTSPRYYIPYAGYFDTKAPRDEFIKDNNLKNYPEDTIAYLKKAGFSTMAFNPVHFDRFIFNNGSVEAETIDSPPVYTDDTTYTGTYIEAYKAEYKLTDNLVLDYFGTVAYREELELFIVPTNDTFDIFTNGYFVDFSGAFVNCTKIPVEVLEEKYKAHGLNRKELIYVREEALACILKNKLPWEDMSIGFQCRFKRNPDVYNAGFWHYFTNVHIGHEHFRYDSYCGGACEKLHQKSILY